MYLEDIDRKLVEKDYKNITHDECKILVELVPYSAAVLIKDLVEERKSPRCHLCRVKVTRQTSTIVSMKGELRKLCQECYFEWYYGI